eukprot:2253881-Alexandrium_andersonii.AAC.1
MAVGVRFRCSPAISGRQGEGDWPVSSRIFSSLKLIALARCLGTLNEDVKRSRSLVGAACEVGHINFVVSACR